MTSSRSQIISGIRDALSTPTPQPFSEEEVSGKLYPEPEPDLALQFAREFTALKGQFAYCENEKELITLLTEVSDKEEWSHLFCWEESLQEMLARHDFRRSRIGKDIARADAGITGCEALIARTGTVLLSSAQKSGRTLPVFPPVHIVIAYADQLIYDLEDAIQLIQHRYGDNLPSMINIMSGPSRTADIEKTLVLGAHGPKAVYVFMLER